VALLSKMMCRPIGQRDKSWSRRGGDYSLEPYPATAAATSTAGQQRPNCWPANPDTILFMSVSTNTPHEKPTRTDAAAEYERQRLADGAACLEKALHYRRAFGWSVLALCPPDHVGVGKKHGETCKTPGKRPWHYWQEFEERLPTEEEVRTWWRQMPTSNLGVALGPVSNMVRIDSEGQTAIRQLEDISGGDLPATLEFRSGRADGTGRGILYGIPDGIVFQTTKQFLQDGELRFQARGAQTVLPPSRHKDGGLYQWLPGHGPDDLLLAPAPAWAIKRWSVEAETQGPPQQGTSNRTVSASDRAQALDALAHLNPERAKNYDDWLHVGMGLHSVDSSEEMLSEWDNWSKLCPEKYKEHGCAEKWSSFGKGEREKTINLGSLIYWARKDSAGSNGQGTYGVPDKGGTGGRPCAESGPAPEHRTDLGNARRLVRWHGADLHFCHPWKEYFAWDGRRWRLDDTAEAMRRAKQTVRKMFDDAAAEVQVLRGQADQDGGWVKQRLDAATKMLAFALASESSKSLTAMLRLAASEPGVPVLPPDLDANPWLFNCANGTLDLRTGQLCPHRREDLLTKLSPVVYDPNAKCPLWERFLNRIMDGRRELIDYLRRVVGYGLTADVSEQCIWFFHGGGANGKSTFLSAVLSMMGDYGMQAVSELLMVKNNEAHPTERADLFGKRFVATIETEEGKRLAEALVKQLTGGDRIRARWMRQNHFEFDPTHKLILAANHRPIIRGCDHAIWRRIKLLPFTVTIPEAEKDKGLLARLVCELPGILAWGVRGCEEWRSVGLCEPEEVRRATAEYQSEQNTVQGFLSACCVLLPEARCRAKALWEAYVEWSSDKLMTQRRFSERLQEAGYHSERGTGGAFYWHGIGLPANPPVEWSQ